ncbi:hypothetical protein [Streptomyces sp. A012304]|uniref:hypothetical protein n=1 Tax=Streptomyces sp. A012304 TaxID=375446 RepID=UPI0022324BD5|nr:hypothetical protein [Streptomyces sp. A012304]GKQ34601.1 hypothetical protein ALMP_11500 [Streptomyces sp. A012304]
MAKQGPQKIPGASQRYFYGEGAYSGSDMEVNCGVVHTTEGRTLPSYNGGAMAPTVTGVPDIAAKRIRWYQHYDVDESARALANKLGGVATNTANAFQIELVGTCDDTKAKTWGTARAGVDYLHWPTAPDWALAEVAWLVRWLHDYHGVPLTCVHDWLAYGKDNRRPGITPASYGTSPARMSNAEWQAFTGWCGHQHVPENDHGDPGSMDFARVIEHAKASGQQPAAPAPTQPAAKEGADVAPMMLDESNPNDVELPSGEWVGLALADAVLHSGPRLHDTLVHVLLAEDTPAEARVEGRFYLTDTAGKTPSAYLPITRHGGGGHQFALSGRVPAGRHLRFQLRVTTPDDSPVTLLHRAVSGPYWATS